jgi:hypothetical protein
MATVPKQINDQGILSTSSNLTYTAPTKYLSQVSFLFNCPTAYDITVNLTRVIAGTTITMYSLTLDPGDTVETVPYTLFQGDSIEIVTTTSGVNYAMTVGNIPLSSLNA